MNTDLIRYTIDNNTGKRLVNGRDLHEYFEPKSKFSIWIRGKIIKHVLKEGVDYELYYYNKSGNEIKKSEDKLNRYRVECALTFDSALEIAMAHNSKKANNLRKYLAQITKKYDELLKNGLKSSKTYTMSEVADFLQLEDYFGKVGRNRLYEILKDKEILDYKNRPIEKFVRRGYFNTDVNPYVVTESGLEWLSTSILVLKSKTNTPAVNTNTNNSDSVSLEDYNKLQSDFNKLNDEVDKIKTGINLLIENTLIAKSGGKTSDYQSHNITDKMKNYLGSGNNNQKALGQ